MATIRFYFDEMMSRIVAKKLIEAGIEVILAVDVAMTGEDDDMGHLVYAAEHELVMVTQDRPFAGRTTKHRNHTGLICWIGEQNDFGSQIHGLSQFVHDYTPETAAGQVFWLK